MFTGLVREIGYLRRRNTAAQVMRLEIHAPTTAPQLSLGGSLAVNGICLTVVRIKGSVIVVEAAAETLRTTTLKTWRVGRRLHLEPALRMNQALDGHLVLGHVDGTGLVTRIKKAGGSLLMTVRCGADLARWLLPKGSVAVDGISLTVDSGPHSDSFTVNLVPYTLRWTIFETMRVGHVVNLEMDALVKAARTGPLKTVLANQDLSGSTPSPTSALASDADRSTPVPAKRGTILSLDDIRARGFHRKGSR